MRLSFPLLLLPATAVQAFAPVPKAATTLKGLSPGKQCLPSTTLKSGLGETLEDDWDALADDFLQGGKKMESFGEEAAAKAFEGFLKGEKIKLEEDAAEMFLNLLGLEDAEGVLKAAFSISDIFKLLRNVLQKKPGDVFHEVTIPDNPHSDFNTFVALKVVAYAVRILLAFNLRGFVNSPKYKSFEAYHDIVISNSDLGEDLKGYPNYRHFGDNHHLKSLTELLKTNPFFASGLSKSDDGGYNLITYSPDTPEDQKTRCLKVIDKLEHCNPIRANFYFNKDMTLKTFEVFDISKPSGSQVVDVDTTDAVQMDKYASATFYHMLFYVSCQHATLHVLHYIATSALQSTADQYEHLKALKVWSKVYSNDIKEKYREVGSLLITDPPADGKPDLSIITGVDGFGASQAIRPLLVDMLNDWGENPTAEGWVKAMMNIDEDEMRENGILEQFWKHYDLVPGYASEIGPVLREVATLDFGHKEDGKKAQEYLADYLQNKCGSFKCTIKNFEEWTEMMAITGIVHGCTLSYTRAIGINDVVRWRTSEDFWDSGDMSLMQGGLGTLCGTQAERHVMGGDNYMRSLLPSEVIKDLKHVIDKYNGKAQLLKAEHIKEVTAREDFEELGWIWTDFGTEGFDGKQLTMTTYI